MEKVILIQIQPNSNQLRIKIIKTDEPDGDLLGKNPEFDYAITHDELTKLTQINALINDLPVNKRITMLYHSDTNILDAWRWKTI